jgi:hypothetical protein
MHASHPARSLVSALGTLAALAPAAAAQTWLYAPREYAQHPQGSFVAQGDVDGDGDVDLLQVEAPTVGYAKRFRVYHNDGAGEFVPGGTVVLDPAQTYATYSMLPILADVDGDGDLDAVFSVREGPSGPGFELRRGNGDGTFGPPLFTALEGILGEGAAGDVDGDGVLELALENASAPVAGASRLVRWWTWNGAGFTPSAAVSVPYQPGVQSLAVGDWDGDGVDEIAIGHRYVEELLILESVLGAPVPAGTVLVPIGPGPIEAFAADFGGDGRDDLLVAVRTAIGPFSFDTKAELCVLTSTGAGFAAGPVSTVPDLPDLYTVDPLWIADWDGDGDRDVIAASVGSEDAGFAILANDGSAAFAPAATVLTKDVGPGAGAADLNGDGYADFVAPQSVLLGDGTLRSFPTLFPSSPILSPGLAVDFEGDGDVDYLRSGGQLMRNDGAGTFADPVLLMPAPAPGHHYGATVAMGDLDGDGAPDLVRELFAWSELVGMRLLSSDGLGSLVDAGFAAPAGVGIAPILLTDPNPTADLDLDGDLDVLHTNGFWPNDGTGFFPAFAPAYAGYPLHAADADADGSVDVLATNGAFTELSLQRNQGGLAFQSELLGTTSTWFARTGRFLDLEADGLVDVVVGLPPEGVLRVYANTGAGYAESELAASPYEVDLVGLLDVDGDGIDDLICAPYLSVYPETRVTVHRRSDPHAAIYDPVRYFGGTAVRAIVDVDADGDLDLLGAGPILNRAVHGDAAGLIRQYGVGSPGSGGAVPVLGASGPAAAGSTTYALHLRLGLGGTLALLGLGTSEVALPDAPLAGMTLYVGGLLPPLTFPSGGPTGVAGAGAADLPFFPTPALVGLAIFHQAVFVDPAGASGVSATNGLEVRFGP